MHVVVSRPWRGPGAGQPDEVGPQVQVRGGRRQDVGLVRPRAALFQTGDGRLRQAQRITELGLGHPPVLACQCDDPAVVAAPGRCPDLHLLLHGSPPTLRIPRPLPLTRMRTADTRMQVPHGRWSHSTQ